MSKICENCKSEFDQKEHIPISLNCSHVICFECNKKLKNNNPEGYCPICQKLSIGPFKSSTPYNLYFNEIRIIIFPFLYIEILMHLTIVN